MAPPPPPAGRVTNQTPAGRGLKLRFRVLRRSRNDTFLRTFVKSLLFFASQRTSAVGNGARDSTSWGRRRSASARGQSVWAAAEGRGRRAELTCQPPTPVHQ